MHILTAELDVDASYKLLSGSVVPRPVAWITTLNAAGGVNLAPFSAFTYVSVKPPMIGVNVMRRGQELKDTAINIHARGEFVANIADFALVENVHLSSIEHPPEVSEAALLGLATAPSAAVRTPRLAIAPIALECRLHRVLEFGETGAQFVIGEVVAFHVRDELLEAGRIDTRKLDPIARIGGPRYARLGEIITQPQVAQTPKAVLHRPASDRR